MKTTDKFVFFWGGEDVFSNFYHSVFTHQGIEFKWSEQAVMYRKAMLFGAKEIAQEILKAPTPKKCKELGRSREIPFNEETWVQHRITIYTEVLLDKFSKPKLKEVLLQTGNRTLAEASPYDGIWGIKLPAHHVDAENPSKWKGQNLLGQVLEAVRKELRRRDNVSFQRWGTLFELKENQKKLGLKGWVFFITDFPRNIESGEIEFVLAQPTLTGFGVGAGISSYILKRKQIDELFHVLDKSFDELSKEIEDDYHNNQQEENTSSEQDAK